MRLQTLELICCPICKNSLRLSSQQSKEPEIEFGELSCAQCAEKFPVLAGVAILVSDVRSYLCAHVKGITKHVADLQIPKKYRRDFLDAKTELEEMGAEHIEEDLEADRVNALYLATHYLRADPSTPWWDSKNQWMSGLIEKYWDQGPRAIIEKWVPSQSRVVELGCGVGGLARRLNTSRYLGIDSSFASILLARKLNLTARSHVFHAAIAADLFEGALARKIEIPSLNLTNVDFIVAELENSPIKTNDWNVSISLNMIDMLEKPEDLPQLQNQVLSDDGLALQSSPYIWHSRIADALRAQTPANIAHSAQAIAWLYAQNGLQTIEQIDNVPWLFFKNSRQIELYSVHMMKTCKDFHS